jgi:transposase InsO family protein
MEPDTMSIDERYKCIRRVATRYRAASRPEKGQLLDMLSSQTGLHRKSLLRLLRQGEGPQRHPQRQRRSRSYGGAFDDAIRVLGRSLNWVCAERMHGILLERAEHLARFDHLTLSDTVRQQLAQVSLSTLRRTIKRLRQDEPRLPQRRGRRPTPSTLAQQIPVERIAADIAEVGHWELDLVYHGGAAADGVYTLQMIDVRTAWSERRAIYGRSERAVVAAMEDIIAHSPLPIHEVHSDNGTEFLNHHLQTLLAERLVGCRVSRSRPWFKNDNRFVEQKNYTLVRAYLPRSVCLLTPQQAQELNALYEDMGLYYNLFEPVLRQTLSYTSYTPDGHVRIRRCYDRARTPLARLLETDTLSAAQAQALQQRYWDTDPLLLLESIRRRLDDLVAPAKPSRRALPLGNIPK